MKIKVIHPTSAKLVVYQVGPQGPIGPQGIPGVGIAPGGTTGQVLKKVDDTDYNAEWGDEAGGSSIVGLGQIAFGDPSTGILTSSARISYLSGVFRLESGAVATDMGYRLDATGIKIGPYSNLGVANTYPFEVQHTNGNSLLRYLSNGLFSTFYIDNPVYGNFLAIGFISGTPYLQPTSGYEFRIYASGSSSITSFNTDGTVWTSGSWRFQTLAGTGIRKLAVDADGDLVAVGAVGDALIVPISDESTALTTGTAKITFRVPYAFVILGVSASLKTAQTSGSIFTIDINKNGTSVLSTKITIDNTEKTSSTAATPPIVSTSAFAAHDEITIDIDQVGDGTAVGCKVELIILRTT